MIVLHRVLVTGANGFIGQALISKLLENGISVIAVDLSFKDTSLPDSEFLTKLETSLEDIHCIAEKFRNVSVDTIYHLAWKGVNGVDKADPIVQVENIKIAMKCAMLAEELNCGRLLCAGTVAENSLDSLNFLEKVPGGMLYAASKISARLMLQVFTKSRGISFAWMQFANIYGPTNKTGNLVSYTIDQLRHGKKAVFGPAIQAYDFIFIDDLIEAIYRLGKCKLNYIEYYIGSGNPKQLKDYLIAIGETMNASDSIDIGARPDDGIKYSWEMFDINNMVHDIGVYAKTSFHDGIKLTIDNYSE